MHREICFRAWDYNDEILIYNYEMFLQEAFKYKYPLMQFTGLTDKNGREIYEGDIMTDEYGSIATVIYYSKYAQFRLDYGDDDIHLFDGQHEEMWVVGNIYENPELIK